MQGRVFTFEGHDIFLFGRDEQNCHAFIREDPFVSRHHFLLEVNPPQSRLRDLGSRNGTFVNGRKHGGRAAASAFQEDHLNAGPSIDLRNGDVITAGKTVFQIFVQTEPEITATCCFDAYPEDLEPAKHQFIDAPANASNDEIRRTVVEMPSESLPGRQTVSEIPRHALNSIGRKMTPDQSPPASSLVGRQTIVESGGQVNRASSQVGRATLAEGDHFPAGDFRRRQRVPADAVPDRLPGQSPTLDGFQIRQRLGTGSLGEVFLADRTIDGSPVAIKFLRSCRVVSPRERDDFLKQADVYARLRHRNIVQSYASGSLGNEFYFVNEFCNAGSLAQLFRQKRNSLQLKHVAMTLYLILDGLAYAHEKGVVHRAIKPSNLLVSKRDGRWIPKLGDFGLAKDFERAGLAGMTVTGSYEDNLPYTPREQLTNYQSVNPANDVFSLAASFYHLITGRFPRGEQNKGDLLSVILNGDIQFLRTRFPKFHGGLASVLDMALQDDCNRRFSNAREMQLALHQVMQKEGWS